MLPHRVDQHTAHASGGAKHEHSILAWQRRRRSSGGRALAARLLQRRSTNADRSQQCGATQGQKGLGRSITESRQA